MFDAKLANCVHNGAPIIQRHHLWQDGDEWIVLCDWRGRYVTWRMDGQTGACYSGNYFDSYDAAESNYLERIGAARLQAA